VLREARAAALKTSVMFGPLLPYLSDSQASIDALLERAGDLGIDQIWVDSLNPRPKVWPAVAELLRDQFPDLSPRYRQMLFSRPNREAYLAALRARVARAAGRLSLAKRLDVCF
jgi:DNA repair photolyase